MVGSGSLGACRFGGVEASMISLELGRPGKQEL